MRTMRNPFGKEPSAILVSKTEGARIRYNVQTYTYKVSDRVKEVPQLANSKYIFYINK